MNFIIISRINIVFNILNINLFYDSISNLQNRNQTNQIKLNNFTYWSNKKEDILKQSIYLLYQCYSANPEEKQIIETPQQLNLFQKYLLNFERNSTKLNATYLQQPYYIPQDKQLQFWTQSTKQWITHQISIWPIHRDIQEQLNEGLFTFQKLAKNHPNQLIDIRIQKPQDSFDIDESSNSKGQPMLLKDYILYIEDRITFQQKFPNYPKDKLLFAVNIDMDKWDEEIIRLNNFMPPSLSADNGLQFLRQQILGVNVPQLYLKVPGVWTGGHQENSSLNSINYNHGPGECLWITVDAEHIPKLLELQPNIIINEGLWFKEIDYFLENKIPVKQIIQRPGDLIILGTGCLHWVKSLEYTMNSSWNILTLSTQSIQEIIFRQEMDQKIKKKTVIPIQNLMLDLYIHTDLDILRTPLMKLCIQENDQFQKILPQVQQIEYNPQSRLILKCTKCQREIFNRFQLIEKNKIHCIYCVEGKVELLELKYNPFCLESLLNTNNRHCNEAYCSHYHLDKSICTSIFTKQAQNVRNKIPILYGIEINNNNNSDKSKQLKQNSPQADEMKVTSAIKPKITKPYIKTRQFVKQQLTQKQIDQKKPNEDTLSQKQQQKRFQVVFEQAKSISINDEEIKEALGLIDRQEIQILKKGEQQSLQL